VAYDLTVVRALYARCCVSARATTGRPCDRMHRYCRAELEESKLYKGLDYDKQDDPVLIADSPRSGLRQARDVV
jgi:hypothetical protein